jgi:hypothetical protein
MVKRDPVTAAALHNKLAGAIAAEIIRPVLADGGDVTEIMVLTESVVVGIALACIKLGGDEKVLDSMFEAAKVRLAELRLKDIETAGRG